MSQCPSIFNFINSSEQKKESESNTIIKMEYTAKAY
uniref:Bm284 n=1 Tax=Brugia malayi TaxID=6279 RepID=A0A1I9G0E8_BRUMA|nr:Bm284 [Brugia malayi]